MELRNAAVMPAAENEGMQDVHFPLIDPGFWGDDRFPVQEKAVLCSLAKILLDWTCCHTGFVTSGFIRLAWPMFSDAMPTVLRSELVAKAPGLVTGVRASSMSPPSNTEECPK